MVESAGMDRPRLIRGLRIAVSTVFGIVCVLLIVLWIRASYTVDYFYTDWGDWTFTVLSSQGKVFIQRSMWISPSPKANAVARQRFRDAQKAVFEKDLSMLKESGVSPIPKTNSFGFRWFDWNNFVVPYWLPVTFSGVLATAPWFRRRFSLRTLLIATTLIAVLLATAAYLRF